MKDLQTYKRHVYIFVSKDLTSSQQVVQASHAAINATAAFDLGSLPDHPHLVILAVKNESKLLRAQEYLKQNNIQYTSFYESDFDDKLTSIATEPIQEHQRSIFKKFQCLKSKEIIFS